MTVTTAQVKGFFRKVAAAQEEFTATINADWGREKGGGGHLSGPPMRAEGGYTTVSLFFVCKQDNSEGLEYTYVKFW